MIQTRRLFARDHSIDSYNPYGDGQGAVYVESWSLFDGFGRLAQSNTPSPTGGTMRTRTIYDSRDNPVRQAPAHHSALTTGSTWWDGTVTEMPAEVLTTFDPLGNPTQTQQLESNVATRSATATHATDRMTSTPMAAAGSPAYAATTQWLDADGNVWQVTEHNNAGADRDTLYRYDHLNRLTQITDAGTNVTTLAYNRLGWRTSLIDPNAGASGTVYYPTGQVRHTVDAANQVLFHRIDDLGRVTATHTSTTYSSANLIASYLYDGQHFVETIPHAIGYQTLAESFVDGTLTTSTATTAIDAAGRPTATRIRVPVAEGPLPGDENLTLPITTTVS